MVEARHPRKRGQDHVRILKGDHEPSAPFHALLTGGHMRRTVAGIVAILLLSVPGCGGDEDATQKVTTIAFLRSVNSGNPAPLLAELRGAGFREGDTLRILPTDPNEAHALPEDAREVVEGWIGDGADLIFAFSSTGAAAAAEATADVPILFLVNDPSAVGLVESEEAPEGNLTGVTFRVPADRTLALARDAIPGLAKIGILFPADDPAAPPHRDALTRAGPDLGIEVVAEAFRGDDDVVRAIDALVGSGAQAIVVANAPTAIRSLATIEPAAAERRIPLIANTDIAASALLVLQPDTDELLAQLGRQAVRILTGADPGDVPVENPRTFEVIVNAKAAADLGLPPLSADLLRQADTVIEA